MAKITGPLFSRIAHGALARAMIFQNDGTTQTVKRYRAPTYRTSPQQLTRRQTYRDAAAAWQLLTTPEKNQWSLDARGDALTGWNLFLSTYLRNTPPLTGTAWDNGITIWDGGATTWD